MPLFEHLPADPARVAALLAVHWPGVALGEQLKRSQNTTFAASSVDGPRFAVRATPDPEGRHRQRCEDETHIVRWLATQGGLGGVCAPLPTQSQPPRLAVCEAGLVLSVFHWAEGAPLDFGAMRWLTDELLARAWGGWLARLHAGTRAFAAAHPDVAARVRRFDQLHDGVMAGAPLHPDDAAVMDDPARFCICHSDLNLSNFYVRDDANAAAGQLRAAGSSADEGAAEPALSVFDIPHEGAAEPALSVFDFDQLSYSWPEYDVSAAALTAFMLSEGGSLPAGEPVPLAEQLAVARLGWLADGYDAAALAAAAAAGQPPSAAVLLDRARLARMVDLRRTFYGRFTARALAEGGVPDDMAWFLRYVERWMERYAASAAARP